MNKAAQSLGRLGGKAGTGAAKARTSEQARAAVQARWKNLGIKLERRVQPSRANGKLGGRPSKQTRRPTPQNEAVRVDAGDVRPG